MNSSLQRQRCLTGTFVLLLLLTFLCTFGLLFRVILVVRPYYKFCSWISGKGWTWNAMEEVAIPVSSLPAAKVRHRLSGGLLDAFDELASSHIKSPARVHCPKQDSDDDDSISGTDGEEPEVNKGYACDNPDRSWFSTRASLARYKYETVAELMGLRRGHRVLDWGAGCGHAIDLVAGKRGFKAVAIDLAESNVEWGRQNLHHLDVFCALDGARLPFNDKSFDAILSNGALDHVADQEDQCKIINDQVMRVLRPGGCAWFGDMGAHSKRSQAFWKHGSCKLSANAGVYTFHEKAMFGVSGHAFTIFVCRDSSEGIDDVESFKDVNHIWHKQRHAQDPGRIPGDKQKHHASKHTSDTDEADDKDDEAGEDARPQPVDPSQADDKDDEPGEDAHPQLTYTVPAKDADASQEDDAEEAQDPPDTDPPDAAQDDAENADDDQQSTDPDDTEHDAKVEEFSAAAEQKVEEQLEELDAPTSEVKKKKSAESGSKVKSTAKPKGESQVPKSDVLDPKTKKRSKASEKKQHKLQSETAHGKSLVRKVSEKS
mmetsp:Transcript_117163/g.215461  ORF Transcript_117163/g.215461 Transcript_117163/m.215461 type:complete len:543 (-) Transcript_117163:83-1711(-)